jgi:hypothetical protein
MFLTPLFPASLPTPSKCLGAEANQTFLSSVSTWPSRGLLDFEEEEEEEPYWVVSCALSPERALLMEFDLDAHVAQLTHKLLSRHLSKLAGRAALVALDPKTAQHANLFYRRNRRRELTFLQRPQARYAPISGLWLKLIDWPKGANSRPEQVQQTEQAYSITSSARARKASGIGRPIAFAAFTLTTSSNLVERCTGRSAAFSPPTIRPV